MTSRQIGKYTILEELGRGGFGTVYRAKDKVLDREVALKLLHPQLMVDMGFTERFRKEAQLVARLDHPNIVTIYDMGEAEGQVYIAMRYLPGGSLRDRLKARIRIPFDQAMEVLRQVGAGLSAAHAKGLVHRDIKPENILFSEDDRAVIADFGLAKAIQASSSSGSGSVGTPGYRAPELWRGNPPAGPATDEYALACIFIEMLTGEQVFDGDTPDEIIAKHLVSGAVLPQYWPTGVPDGVNVILEKALAKDPAERYPRVDGFVAALERLVKEAGKQKETTERQMVEEKARQEEQARQKVIVMEKIHSETKERLQRVGEIKARESQLAGAVVGTIAAIVLCGLPGVSMCFIGTFVAIGKVPDPTYFLGNSGFVPNWIGFAFLCVALIFIAIAVVVPILLLRKKKPAAAAVEVLPPQEPLPPAS
jgi:serine/threonine protein kinase